jgi:endoglucanase
MMLSRSLLAGVVLAAHGGAEIIYAGVNSGEYNVRTCEEVDADRLEAGGEFAQQNLPGAFGVDYQFINESAIDFFIGAGINTVRLPFLLVRRSYIVSLKDYSTNTRSGANVSDRDRSRSYVE